MPTKRLAGHFSTPASPPQEPTSGLRSADTREPLGRPEVDRYEDISASAHTCERGDFHLRLLG